MSDNSKDAVVTTSIDKYRQLVGIRYLNASEAICKGLENSVETNQFHFLISLRSFIEYTRRGMWFLVWATDEQLKKAEKLTFSKVDSPPVAEMDRMVIKALDQGDHSPLMDKIPVFEEPFLHLLHALTHGNPISVRLLGMDLPKVFHFQGLLMKAQTELSLFRVLMYRALAGQSADEIWNLLKPICNSPEKLAESAIHAALMLPDLHLRFASEVE